MTYVARSVPWRLRWSGPAELLFVWKAATQTWRTVDRRVLLREEQPQRRGHAHLRGAAPERHGPRVVAVVGGVLSLAEHPEHKGQLYAGTGHAFYYSLDDGAHGEGWADRVGDANPGDPVRPLGQHPLRTDQWRKLPCNAIPIRLMARGTRGRKDDRTLFHSLGHRIIRTAASGSSPLTWNTGAETILATSVQ